MENSFYFMYTSGDFVLGLITPYQGVMEKYCETFSLKPVKFCPS
jgi:hypothetical protein